MRVFLTTPTFDLAGAVQLTRCEKSDISASVRRATRTATLDGGVVISDSGFADGDGTFSITSRRASKALQEKLYYLHRNYPLVILSCEAGCFSGCIYSMGRRGADLFFTFWVKERLSEV